MDKKINSGIEYSLNVIKTTIANPHLLNQLNENSMEN